MHSFHGKSCNIHFNSDMSGELFIINKKTEEQVVVSAEDILMFVAEYVRRKKISELENMSSENLLK